MNKEVNKRLIRLKIGINHFYVLFITEKKSPRLWTNVHYIYDWRGSPGSNERNASVQPAQQKWKTIAKQRERKKEAGSTRNRKAKEKNTINIDQRWRLSLSDARASSDGQLNYNFRAKKKQPTNFSEYQTHTSVVFFYTCGLFLNEQKLNLADCITKNSSS